MGMAAGLRNGSLINQTIPLGTASRAIFVVVVVIVVVIEVIVVPRILAHRKVRRFFDFDYDNDNDNEHGG
jgi:hypothetical protein